ncbi:hypothetical protein ABZV58_31595 [Nocardia sp. NPDC004654]|uniref:hypothetical protein n=1 Tax=Nocardia sp. NPDC004654 TaxID=3154776 RepID=UPI0033AF7072
MLNRDLEERKHADNYMYVLFSMVLGVLDSAVDDKVIRGNPCRAKKVRHPIARRPKVVVWPNNRRIALLCQLEKVLTLAMRFVLHSVQVSVPAKAKSWPFHRTISTARGGAH